MMNRWNFQRFFFFFSTRKNVERTATYVGFGAEFGSLVLLGFTGLTTNQLQHKETMKTNLERVNRQKKKKKKMKKKKKKMKKKKNRKRKKKKLNGHSAVTTVKRTRVSRGMGERRGLAQGPLP